MTLDAELSQSQDERLQEVIAAYLRDAEAGRNPDRAEILVRHPDLAGELQEFFAGQEQLDRLAAPLRQAIEPASDYAITGTLGDFRIVREVGRGGMGIVYEAEQISLRRRVALKVLPFAATMDPRHLQRFHNEAQAAACLHHTNIVPVFSVGSERGVHFYAMQFIDGQPLSEIIRQLREREKKHTKLTTAEPTTAHPMPPEGAIATSPTVGLANDSTPLTGAGRRGRDYYRKVAELGIQAAEALDHAHQLGIVHRDIKPGNLMLDSRGNLWVTDFGLAQVQHGEASLTATGQALGTPRYMSPEQALARRVVIDHRTDVYSLGATLYELLTLRPAFGSEDRQELLRQIAVEEPARPRRVERAIPAELEIIVLKAMEKRPQDRYTTAQELADDLERWLKHEPIHARRPSLLQRSAKWGRRHKHAVTASALVLLMALLFAGYITVTRHDQTLRQTASEQFIRVAMEEGNDWQAQRRLPEALSATRRANGLLAGTDVDAALRQRVQARLADLELVERLENARLEKMTAVKDGHFDWQGTDTLFAQTFRDAGLEVEAVSAEEAGARIQRSTVTAELAAILDLWALIRRTNRGTDDPTWKHLVQVAREGDLDIARTRVREALERSDRQVLLELVASEEVFHLPPATLYVVGFALSYDKKVDGRVETFLREAQRRYPSDFWLNQNVFFYLGDVQPPQREEAIRFASLTVALRPESPATHNNLSAALVDGGRVDEAITEYREALRLKQDYAEAHHNLGVVLGKKGLLDEAIAELREAIRLKKDYADAHNNLGNALSAKGRLNEAIVEFRAALHLKEDFVAHYNLGNALRLKGRLDEAITEYRQSIRLKRDEIGAHNNLGIALAEKGQLDEAVAAFREAIRLKEDFAESHNNLGNALARKGRLDEAVSEFRKAIHLKKDYAAYCNLGFALSSKGQFDEAIGEFREAIRLKKDFTLARNLLRQAEQIARLDNRLPRILEGKEQPKDAADRLAFAWLCQQTYKQRYAAAARFYSEAFAEEPKRADDLDAQHRYNAACAAALAGCGQGKDAEKRDAKERAGLRQQALDWLRSDLKVYRQVMEKSADKAGPMIAERMQYWLKDKDSSVVRRAESLAQLPETERKEWHKLWQEVEALLQQATKQPKSTNVARP